MSGRSGVTSAKGAMVARTNWDCKHVKICTSNLIFGRSKSQAHLSNEQMLADCCWPIHEWIMEQVQPRMILCIGGSKIPDYMIRKGRSRFIEECPSGHGDWMCQAIQWNVGPTNLYSTFVTLQH